MPNRIINYLCPLDVLIRCLLSSGYDRYGWYFFLNNFYYAIYGSRNTWTLNALRGEKGHGIDEKKNVNTGNLMYVKTQGKSSVVNKDVNICTSRVTRNPANSQTTVRGTDILALTCRNFMLDSYLYKN